MHAALGVAHFEPAGATSASFWHSFVHASMSCADDRGPEVHLPSAAASLAGGVLPPHAIAAPRSAAHADERKSSWQRGERIAVS